MPPATVPATVDALYSAAQARACDQYAIHHCALPGLQLMHRAGRAAHACLAEHWPGADLTVYCGKGNNAGDGWIVAGLAHVAGQTVQVLQVGDGDALEGDAAAARAWALTEGVQETPFAPATAATGAVLVDALLGTGLTGAVRAPFAEAVQHLNGAAAAGAAVLALDLPSGLSADTGAAAGVAVRADRTLTFILPKQGLALHQGPDLAGPWQVADLAVPAEAVASVGPGLPVLHFGRRPAPLPRRPRAAHKGDSGRVLLVGGADGTCGALLLAAEAALRGGAGLVSAALAASGVPALLARCPEVMATAAAHGSALDPLLAVADVVVCGPGLGTGPWGQQALARVLASGLPLVLDADALNLLAAGTGVGPLSGHGAPVLLTPHPGEAARLLGTDAAAVQADRVAAVQALAAASGAWVALKGNGTLVAGPDGNPPALCPHGNPGMATGGTGDVLAGLAGALLAATPAAPGCALQRAVQLHAVAGDRAAAAFGERGLRASDLPPLLPALLAGDR